MGAGLMSTGRRVAGDTLCFFRGGPRDRVLDPEDELEEEEEENPTPGVSLSLLGSVYASSEGMEMKLALLMWLRFRFGRLPAARLGLPLMAFSGAPVWGFEYSARLSCTCAVRGGGLVKTSSSTGESDS